MNWRVEANVVSGPWHLYRIFLDEEKVVEAKWLPMPDDVVEVHCECQGRVSVLRKVKKVFDTEVRPDIRAAGYRRVIAVFPVDDSAAKALKFIRYMGFDFFSGMMEA